MTKKHTITHKDFEHETECPCCSRRRTFIKTLTVATAGLILPQEWAKAATTHERMIKMHNPHTGEDLRTIFWTPEYGYIQPALDQVNKFFRDFRENKIVPIDIDLLNILHYMQSNVGINRTIELHSGYRTPKTNRLLASRSDNVAKNSLHMKAKAADISVRGYNSLQLKTIALGINGGGIGRYYGGDYIHVDSGARRQWHY